MSVNGQETPEPSNMFRALVIQGDAVQFVIQTPEGTVVDTSWKADLDDEDMREMLMAHYEPKLFDKIQAGAAFIPTGRDEGFTRD